MFWDELENHIRNYRRHFFTNYKDVLVVLISREDFELLWGRVPPQQMYYDDGKRRIRWYHQETRYKHVPMFLSILQPDPDDAPGSNVNLVYVTLQQVIDLVPLDKQPIN